MARVFISYAQDSRAHAGRVLDLGTRLAAEGFEVALDQFIKYPVRGWAAWSEQEIQRADYVIVVGSRSYLRRYNGEERVGSGLGATWEAAIVRQLLYEAGTRAARFVPVVFAHQSANTLPPVLRQYQVGRLWRDWDAIVARLKGIVVPEQSSAKLDKHTTSSRVTAAYKAAGPGVADESSCLNQHHGRRFLQTGLQQMTNKAGDIPISILLLDVDDLTQINKHFGTGVGDRVLGAIGSILTTQLPDARAGRCGDDTFFVVLWAYDIDMAEGFASKLRKRINSFEWRRIVTGLHVSCSVGIAEHQQDEQAVHWALRAAQGMLSAKEKGKDQMQRGPEFLDRAWLDEHVYKGGRTPPGFRLVTEYPREYREHMGLVVKWPFS